MPERLRIEDDVERLPADQWQHLVCGHPALRLEVLKTIAANAASALSLRVFLLEDEAGIAAAALCEVIARREPLSALDYLLYGRARHMATRLGVSACPALYFCTPVGTESAVVLRPANPEEQQRILGRLLDEIETHAATQRLGIALVNVFADESLLNDALQARQYLDTDIQPTSRLQIEWSDFEGYARHLRHFSRNSAHTVHYERNRNRRCGVVIRQIQSTAAAAAEVDAFAREHYQRKNGVDLHFGRQFLPQLAALLGDEFMVFEAVRAGRRVGMIGLVRSGSVAWGAWYGIEEIDRPNDFTYSNLVYYHLADVACGLGIKTLLYGTHAVDAKRRRGCQVIGSRLFYRPHRPVARWLARPFFCVHRAWFRRKLG